MASTVFQDYNAATPIVADWLNAVNNGIYDLTGLASIAPRNSYAELRTTVPVAGQGVYLRGGAAVGDGAAGNFYSVTGAAPGTYVDNGGTIIVPTGGDGSVAWLRAYSGALNVKWFGAKGDGVSDDSTAIQSALSSAPNGSTVYRPPGKYYCASSITVPEQITFIGSAEGQGSERSAPFNIKAFNNTILLSNTATINLSSGSVLKDTLICNINLYNAYPFATSAATQSAIAAYAGTSVSVVSAEDVHVNNVRIIGFAQAISLSNSDRALLDRITIDCTAGVLADSTYDISNWTQIECWPFVTYGYSWSTQDLNYYRSGSAFKVTGHFDGCAITRCFSYGYAIGFDMQCLTGIDLIDCWVEGGGASYIAGQIGYSFSVAGDQTNMIACGVDTCDTGVLVNYSGIKLGMNGCTMHANVTGISVLSAVNCMLDGCSFYYPHASGSGSPVAWPAPNALFEANGTSGQIAIANSWLYGNLLCAGVSLKGLTNTAQITNNRIINCTVGVSADAATSSATSVITGNNFNGTLAAYSFLNSTFKNTVTMSASTGAAGDTYGNQLFVGGQNANVQIAIGGANGPRNYGYYATGTPAAPTIVGAGSVLVSYRAYGYDGAAFQQAGLIRLQVDSAPSAGSMPGVLIASTTPTGSVSPVDRNATDSSGNFHPLSDNTYTCGISSNRWSAVWAANGTIQTSDKRTKTDITDASLGLDFITKLRPVSYKWIEGSQKVIRQVYLDAEGKEIPDGDPVPEGATPGRIVTESIPGTRTHWGLIAQEVKDAVDAAGVDFAGWVLTDKNDPNSQQALRYDQFISPLIKAVQELTARVAALESK